MDNLIVVIGGIIVLGLIIGVTALIMKKKESEDGKAAMEFLEGLGNELIAIVLKTVKEIDPSKIESAEEFEVIVLNAVYDNAWDYVMEQINENFDDKSLFKNIMNILDKDYVINFVDMLCERAGLTESIQGEYAAYRLSVNNTEEQDAALAAEYADEEKYHTEEVTENDLEPAGEVVHTEEEIASLNPQVEEDEEFDAEDDSMELVEDESDENQAGKILAVRNKTGAWYFYELDVEGRKSRVSKSYALPIYKEQNPEADLSVFED